MSNSPTVPGAGSGGIRSLLMQRIKVCHKIPPLITKEEKNIQR